MDHHTVPNFERCALVSIDMQNDFVLPSGSVTTQGAFAMTPTLIELVRVFRAKGLPVVHVVRLYEQDGSNADICRRARLEAGDSLLVPGSVGAEVVDGLLPEQVSMDFELLVRTGVQRLSGAEVILYKPRWSAFFQTELDTLLRGWGVDTVAVAGTWFPNCVRQTLYDATSFDYRAIAVRDCIAGMREGDDEGLERAGCSVLESVEFFL